jgi:hypothetical protein
MYIRGEGNQFPNITQKLKGVFKMSKMVNGVETGKMVYCGNVVPFARASSVQMGENLVIFNHKDLIEGLKTTTKWDFVAIETVDDKEIKYEFVTYFAGDNDNFTDITKNGKILMSNLGWKSVERFLIAKNFQTSKAHNCYKLAVGRVTSAKAQMVKGGSL